jgi:ATP-dependent helicase Lhr and Lhr-like helicase
VSGFDLLHPAVQHHVVNSLGWRSLRPLQESAVSPILEGEDCLLLAATAGGKTEAATLPLMSRMAAERWRGLSTIYLCPTKALLNNLHARLDSYFGLIGRRAELWHGDITTAGRARVLRDPPDLLLTTPESLEAILISTRVAHRTFFAGLRAVVVDEAHAFAGDDRGWHMLAVLERIGRVAAAHPQRIGLSATLGNPDEILVWLTAGLDRPRRVVNPAAEAAAPPDVQVDYVATLQNAATVIAALHRGEKRLVFCDSRSQTEELASALRARQVRTYVSHGSLGKEERSRAEQAFAEETDCVIVATATLELGIDVGDLDRVIQINAPATVASFLQRMGRTGRRAGTNRNCLFLAISEESLLQAVGLVALWSRGYVEPVVPPREPLHVLAQQVLALCLQEGRLGRGLWREWLSGFAVAAGLEDHTVGAVIDHLVAAGMVDDDGGMLAIGRSAEQAYGRRHFVELVSMIAGDPLVRVLYGRQEIGAVHHSSFVTQRGQVPVVSLAGRSWRLRHLDWRRRVAQVEPTSQTGRSRWKGSYRPWGQALCHTIREVLTGAVTPPDLSRRASDCLASIRDDHDWVAAGATAARRDGTDTLEWWTFAGKAANRALQAWLDGAADQTRQPENLWLRLADTTAPAAVRQLAMEGRAAGRFTIPDDEALRGLKFADCLPPDLALRALAARMTDPEGASAALDEPLAV